jgi:hypothetical protein
VYHGLETEFCIAGSSTQPAEAATMAGRIVECLRHILPSAATDPPAGTQAGAYDIMTPLGRVYRELNCLIELAGPTCRSAEALAWAYEAGLDAINRALGTLGPGTPALFYTHPTTPTLLHTPTDYADWLAEGQPAHSLASHLNLFWEERVPTWHEAENLARYLAPLNCVFGPGGLSREGGLRFSCDPRAEHIWQLVAGAAHDAAAINKPFFLTREEAHGGGPSAYRLQIAAFGGARSPVSNWLKATLFVVAQTAVLAQRLAPFSDDPLPLLKAPANGTFLATIGTGRSRRTCLRTKAEIAVETIKCLRKFAERAAPDGASAERTVQACDLATQAAFASATSSPEAHIATDVCIKRALLDRVARDCGFDGLGGLGRAVTQWPPTDAMIRHALQSIILADAFFSTPDPAVSTYKLAARLGLFAEPRFELPIDSAQLPEGVATRDRARAHLLNDPVCRSRIQRCSWTSIVTNDRTYVLDPWSDLESV